MKNNIKGKLKIKGISLIILVITIIVLAIIAGTVMISLIDSNIIKMANNAKKASDIATMKQIANTIYADLLLEKKDSVTRDDIVSRLKEQGYTDEQISLITIDIKDEDLVVKSKGIYGIKREVGSTSTSWERIEDSVGLEANACLGTIEPVKNDFDNIFPWSEIVSYNYDVTANKVTSTYGDVNYKTDGTNGDVLTKIPEFYYKRERKTESGKLYEYIYISEVELEGYTKSEKFSVGRYMASFNADKTELKSVSNMNVATNKNITEFRELASVKIIHY